MDTKFTDDQAVTHTDSGGDASTTTYIGASVQEVAGPSSRWSANRLVGAGALPIRRSCVAVDPDRCHLTYSDEPCRRDWFLPTVDQCTPFARYAARAWAWAWAWACKECRQERQAKVVDHSYGFCVPDAIFAHPRLASIYDAFDGSRNDLSAYLALADELGATSVLDVGCGTGSLAVLLADSGRSVVGVDPAEASLEVARGKDPNARVSWMRGDAAGAPALDVDLAVMTGNVAQVFLTEQDWGQALDGIHTALRPAGHLVFETRRPDRRAWEEWLTDTAPVVLDIPGTGPVEQFRKVTDISLPFVSFRCTYRFLTDGAVVTSDSTLRFRDREEVELSLVAHGYLVRDVREAPDRPGCEFVFIAKRTG